MISFVVYQTKIIDNKLTFEFWDSYDEYDVAMKVADSNKDMVVMPYDDDDDENED